jgi:pimeloyl-ACP methyl ester carboxylesterase
MLKRFATTIILIAVIAPVSACGPAAATVRPTSTAVPPPTAPAAAVPPTLPPTPVPPPTVPTAVPTPPPTATPAVPSEEVAFVTTDGVTLAATLFGEGEVAVLLLHMGAGGATQRSWHPFARDLAARGFAALTLDFRGVGRSEGRLQTNRLIYDARAAFEFLRGRGYHHVICMGASMGGTSCMRLALDVEIEGLVVLASTTSTGDPNTVTTEDMARLTMPKLFIVGSRDSLVVVDDMKKMYRSCPAPKELVIYNQASHGTALFATSDGDRLRQKLLDFVEQFR